MTGAEMRAARKKFGMTQTAFGVALGVDARTVQRWEANDTAVSDLVARLTRLAMAEPGLLDRLASA